tara:strand:- start:140 stop:355 length:216 start_codon:yes stop_codon:yes gene_type:complete
MKTATFTVRIQVEDDQEINPFHLSEELQASLNSMYFYDVDSETGEHTDNRILGYKFEYDSFVPFTPQETYA